MGTRKTMWRCWPRYSCVICSSMAWLVCCEEWRCGFANLEVDGTVFDLNDDVRFEFAIEGVKVVVTGAGAVGLEVVIVEVIVVDEAAIEDEAAMRFERASDGVGGFGGSAMVLRGADTTLRVGFDDEAGEVGNGFIDLVDFGSPPGDNGRVDGVEGG